MELLLYAVIFSMILIVSNATNKLVPSLPLPLIQILLGIGWALFVPEENFHLDTELFLALVIGPLLFREAEEADITSVLKHWRIIQMETRNGPPLPWAVRNAILTACLPGTARKARPSLSMATKAASLPTPSRNRYAIPC